MGPSDDVDSTDGTLLQQQFEDFQKSMVESEMDQKRKELMRGELSSYLSQDFKGLLSVPYNFNTIASAMSREDLLSSDEKPWSKYLFEDQFDKDLNKSFAGRYDSIVEEGAPDKRLQRGIAEIHMLDSQLRTLTKKSRAMNELNTVEPSSRGGSDWGSPRSSRSKFDSTFLTRAKGESKYGGSDMGDAPNGGHASPSSQKGSSREQHDTCSSNVASDSMAHSAQAGTLWETQPKNFIKNNIAAIKSRTRLSGDEEKRIQLLLETDDSESGTTSSYVDPALAAELAKIDAALEQFGFITEPYRDIWDTDISDADDGDTLHQQRLERMKKAYETELDNKLNWVQSHELNFEGVIDVGVSCSVSARSHSDRLGETSTSNQKPLQIPLASAVRPDRKIDMNDIHDVIASAQELARQQSMRSLEGSLQLLEEDATREGNEALTEKDADGNADGDAAIEEMSTPTSASSAACTHMSMPTRQDIDRLLAKYRSEVNTLSSLRIEAKRCANASGDTERSTGVGVGGAGLTGDNVRDLQNAGDLRSARLLIREGSGRGLDVGDEAGGDGDGDGDGNSDGDDDDAYSRLCDIGDDEGDDAFSLSMRNYENDPHNSGMGEGQFLPALALMNSKKTRRRQGEAISMSLGRDQVVKLPDINKLSRSSDQMQKQSVVASVGAKKASKQKRQQQLTATRNVEMKVVEDALKRFCEGSGAVDVIGPAQESAMQEYDMYLQDRLQAVREKMAQLLDTRGANANVDADIELGSNVEANVVIV